jgi:hypothetical protein
MVFDQLICCVSPTPTLCGLELSEWFRKKSDREQQIVRLATCERSPLGLSHAQNRMSGRPRVAGKLLMRSPQTPPTCGQKCAPNSCLPERVFSMFNATFGEDQKSSFGDYLELAMQSQYNTSASSDAGILKKGTIDIVAGLYIGKAPTTSFAGINLGAVNIAHPLPNCRLYYSQVTVDPQKSIDYVQRNRNKKVIYRSFVINSWTNINSGGSFNTLVNSGIVHPTAVLICPFIAAVANSGFADFQWKSPFDTCPATLSALSLTNLQVAIGGQNVLNSTLNMT